MSEIANKYQSRCDKTKVISKSYWNKNRAAAAAEGSLSQTGSTAPYDASFK